MRLLLVPAVLIAATGIWLLLSSWHDGVANSEPASTPAVAVAVTPPPDDPAAQVTRYDPFTTEAIAPEQPSPLDRLKLYRQSWRRGGLGSDAQVSFTLRNGNDYAVKDVALACDFIRRDGLYPTKRVRLVPGTIEMRSRKSFARLHIGFVNVNASKAKCTLVSASRT